MKKSELKEMIRTAFLAEMDMTNAQDDDASSSIAADYDPLAEAEEDLDEMLARLSEEEVEEVEDKVVDPYLAEAAEDEATDIEDEVEVDAEEETTDGGEEEKASDSIVIDKKIVSLSSLPSETRKILDTLETLRAQAEEFGDQKFITQVGNTITFFTRDFVVAGDQPTMAKVDEGNKQYYKDAEADDAEHIDALEKDMADDKKDSEVNELFGLFGSKVGKVKKREMALIDKAVDSFSNYSPNTVNKDDIYEWQRELQSLIQKLKSMKDEEYAKARLNMDGGRDNFLKQWVMSKGGTATDYNRQVRSDVINGMNNDGPTFDNAEMYIQNDEMEDFKKAAGMNESLFPMWNKIK